MENAKISREVLETALIDVIDDVNLRRNEIIRLLGYGYYTAEEQQKMVDEQKTLKNILLRNVKKLPGVQVSNCPDGRVEFYFDEGIWC